MQKLKSGRWFRQNFSSIIWDWNGTLLNDLQLCIESINTLLQNRGLPLLNIDIYKEVFSFPVKNYYKKIGFDFSKEDFSIPAKEFIDLYNSRVNTCSLHSSSISILEYFRSQSIKQYVLSAMQQDMLETTLKQNNIIHFFEAVLGLDDHYAVSKIERGRELLDSGDIDKNSTCIIGDTTHDFEVANELGISCVLIADGHQSKQRLMATGATVVDSLNDLM